jgi:multidrug efflux pump subunit AcrB
MSPTPPRSTVRLGAVASISLLAALAGGCTHGPYITHATIEWPGATLRQVDESVAKPVGRHLFGTANGVVEVTSVSSAGKVDLYARSDGMTKQPEFVQSMSESLAESTETLPRGALAGALEVLPKGKPISHPPVHSVEELSIDIDRFKLIDSGLSYDDVSRAVARAREDEAFHVPAGSSVTPAAAQHMIQVLNATTLPSRDKPVTLGDVTSIHIVAVPDVVEHHWP